MGFLFVRRLKSCLSSPVCLSALFVLSFVFLAEAVKPARSPMAYDRTVNVTLDTVMWVHEQHRGAKMTWAELNAEVCARMKVRRTEPWQRIN